MRSTRLRFRTMTVPIAVRRLHKAARAVKAAVASQVIPRAAEAKVASRTIAFLHGRLCTTAQLDGERSGTAASTASRCRNMSTHGIGLPRTTVIQNVAISITRSARCVREQKKLMIADHRQQLLKRRTFSSGRCLPIVVNLRALLTQVRVLAVKVVSPNRLRTHKAAVHLIGATRSTVAQ
jgi:hypothetical protein